MPQTVALTAPSGVIFKRPSMIRWSQPIGERWSTQIALEEPNNDVAFASGGSDVKRYPNLVSTLAYGIADINNASGMADDSVKRTRTASANLIWSPLERFGVGLEYIFAKRENEGGNDADNHRVQGSIQFGF